MRVALYARVSTTKQETDNQLSQLREYARQQQWHVVAEYIDTASGAKSDRPQFKAMFEAAYRREFDLLLFWALDRFTREGTLQTLNYLTKLEDYGVRYRSYTELWLDTAGPFRDVVLSLLATLAKQERKRIQERVKAGLQRARREGKTMGRPRFPVDDSHMVYLRDELKLTPKQIAERLGCSVDTVWRHFREIASYERRHARDGQTDQGSGEPATIDNSTTAGVPVVEVHPGESH